MTSNREVSFTRDDRMSVYIIEFDLDHRDEIEAVLIATLPTGVRTVDRDTGAWHVVDVWANRAAEALRDKGFTVVGSLPGKG